jgi:type VI secretion system protein ImpK
MTTTPSLVAQIPAPTPAVVSRLETTENPSSLLDLMLQGFYMVVLLRNRYVPADAQTFRARVREFLMSLDKGSRRLGVGLEDQRLATYAFVALVDETVLTSQGSLRSAWESNPLQLQLFGDQLAGENFFERLDMLRAEGEAKLPVLEVFHMALLLGFQGKYRIDGAEKLALLTARLGDEIARMRGGRGGFAPHALAPDAVRHTLRHDVPLWVMASAFALAGLLAFLGLRGWLSDRTERDLAAYQGLVKMPEQPAYVTITLP